MLGESFLSLRQPLAVLMVAQAAIIFWILKPKGVATALVGSLAVTSTSFILAPHVSVNWYCLFLFILLLGFLVWGNKKPFEQYWFILGLLLGVMFGIRQFTAVFVGVGLLAWFFAQPPPSREESVCVLARIALLVGSVPLWLVFVFTELPGSLLGIFPLCLFFWTFWRVRWGTRDTTQLLVFLGLGFLAPLLPLAVYHLWYGVFGQWIYDWTVAPFWDVGVEVSYYRFLWDAVQGENWIFWNSWSSWDSWAQAENKINLLFVFLFMVCVLPLSGVLAVWSVLRQNVHPLVFLGPFYLLVPVPYQIFLYNTYVVGIALCIVLWVMREGFARWCGVVFITVFCAVPLGHLAQGLSHDLYNGSVSTQYVLPPGTVSGLRTPKKELAKYKPLIKLIQTHTKPHENVLQIGDDIYGVELNFLARRPSSQRFFFMRYERNLPGAWQNFLLELRTNPPATIVLQKPDTIAYRWKRRFFELVRAFPKIPLFYEKIGEVGKFEVWRCRVLCFEVFLGLAERVGFEPTMPEGTTVFETAPFDRSGTSPVFAGYTVIHQGRQKQ